MKSSMRGPGHLAAPQGRTAGAGVNTAAGGRDFRTLVLPCVRFAGLILLAGILLPSGPASEARQEQNRTRNPHGNLRIPCQNCHTATSWRPIRAYPDFNHNETRYPLRGMHAGVDCAQCHRKMVFTNVGSKCADCHADIHRRQMGSDCEQCHTVRGWQVSTRSVREHQNRFPLLGAHAAVDCSACHTGAAVGQFMGLSTECGSCHLRDYQNAKVIDHKAANFPTTCAECHISVDSWHSARFDHARYTNFALTGTHAQLDCTSCHIGGKFTGTPADCFGCHEKDFTAAKDPNHAAAGFSRACGQCHTTVSWSGAKFDHSALTKFPLTGAHASLTCSRCHANDRFAGTPSDCASCHIAQYNGTTNPSHVAAAFPKDCSLCHTTTNWLGATFDHSKTPFPLTGAHVTVECLQCHANNHFSGTPTQCVACHLADFNKAANPNHAAAGFPQDCTICHNTTQWSGAKFDHNTSTKFALTGVHATLVCSQCHLNNVFAGTPAACSACHITEYNKTTNPNHAAAGFPQDCSLCHTTAGWAGAVFDHTKTPFPLTGAHVTVECLQCHVNNRFAGTPTQCVACHIADFNKATNPNHAAAGFPQDCTICHTTTQWSGAKFDHNTATKFPLTGAHVNLTCSQCHANNVFAGTPTACGTCHLADFSKTTNPNHAAAGFSQDCAICHTTTAWTPATFDHSKTKFPLTGAHAGQPCSACHASGQYATLPTTCQSCHLARFNGTTNPNHVTAGFPQDCSICHSTTAWTPATFDHSKTQFPLTGAHVAQPCSACHANGQYATLPTTCQSCHLAKFNGTTNPNHVTAGFPQDCSLCHTTTAWTPATFDHSKTAFPLTGAHVSVACSLCHLNSVYKGTPTDCYSCHSAVYKATTNPNHVSAGFPTTCQTCHTTTSWSGATFNHTWFPTNHGRANGVCSTCHPNPADYKVFTCTNCHTKSSTDNEHRNVNGYVYNSANCYQCHPRGRGD